MLHLNGVWKTYKMGEVEVVALKDVTVKIRKGDFVAIVGPSGSGKSTIMNLMGCLDLPTKGSIYLKSQDISCLGESDLAGFRGRTIGFVFQKYNLIPTMTAFENVMLPLEFQEVDNKTASKRVRMLLTLVGLGNKMQHRPSELSGGEQQRVAIARALSNNPEVVLADEPTGNLDSVTGKSILEMLYTLWKTGGKTIIVVTHDLKAVKYARTIVELKDGKIVRINSKNKKTNANANEKIVVGK